MKSLEQRYLAHARNELTEHIIYRKLAEREKKPANKALLEELSGHERRHYEFWRTLLPEKTVIEPYGFALAATPLMRDILGVTFTTKFLETHEKQAVAAYEKLLPLISAEHRPELEAIIHDERSHENALLNELKEKRIAYIGFVALGLADAIVEITGVHAGFLGVTGSTLIAGISGIIVGFAAAISMGSAAYLQAKQDTEKSAVASALITGITYMLAVVGLALPYFFIHTMFTAFAISTAVGIILLAAFTFYGAIVFDRKFIREFGESALLMLGTAGATYLLGEFINTVFHVSAASF